ncbi:cytosolic glyceraldehyde-3-phosphate dehydrogenase [Tanacetum coccineum]
MIYDMNPDSRTQLIRRCSGLHPAVHSVISNDDILIEILVRLPIISLLTVKQVSKHWLNLIQEPNFTLLLSQRPKIDPASALYIKRSPFHDSGSDLFSFRTSRFRPANFRLGEGSNGFEIMQSCNGLLLYSVGEKPFRKIYVCNPTIHMFKRLYKCQYGSLRDDCSDCAEVYPVVLFVGFGFGVCWGEEIHWLNIMLGELPTHCKLVYLNERPVLTQVQLPKLHSKSYGDVKMFESAESLLLICWDYEHLKHLGVYEMRNGFTDWRFKYFVDHKDVLRAFGETHWGIRPSVMCIVLGEREEDSFMMLELDEKVVQYKFKFKFKTFCTLRELGSPLWETCVAIDEWVEYPMAHTALDDILPCVGNATSQENLRGSKDVTVQLVGMMTSSGYAANLARKKAIGIVFNTMTEPHSATAIKLASQLPLSQDVPSCYGTIQRPAATQKQFTYGNCTNAAFSYPVAEKLIAANYSPVFVQAQAPSDK